MGIYKQFKYKKFSKNFSKNFTKVFEDNFKNAAVKFGLCSEEDKKRLIIDLSEEDKKGLLKFSLKLMEKGGDSITILKFPRKDKASEYRLIEVAAIIRKNAKYVKNLEIFKNNFRQKVNDIPILNQGSCKVSVGVDIEKKKYSFHLELVIGRHKYKKKVITEFADMDDILNKITLIVNAYKTWAKEVKDWEVSCALKKRPLKLSLQLPTIAEGNNEDGGREFEQKVESESESGSESESESGSELEFEPESETETEPERLPESRRCSSGLLDVFASVATLALVIGLFAGGVVSAGAAVGVAVFCACIHGAVKESVRSVKENSPEIGLAGSANNNIALGASVENPQNILPVAVDSGRSDAERSGSGVSREELSLTPFESVMAQRVIGSLHTNGRLEERKKRWSDHRSAGGVVGPN